MTQQFTIEQLHISPFDAIKIYNERGFWHWEPIERNVTPSGIVMLDKFLQFMASGNYDRLVFYRQEGITATQRQSSTDNGTIQKPINITINDFYGFIHILTGMNIQELHNRFVLLTCDLLLRYTDMNIGDIARRSGAINNTNIARLYKRYHGCTPSERRAAIREKGDLGMYRVIE